MNDSLLYFVVNTHQILMWLAQTHQFNWSKAGKKNTCPQEETYSTYFFSFRK